MDARWGAGWLILAVCLVGGGSAVAADGPEGGSDDPAGRFEAAVRPAGEQRRTVALAAIPILRELDLSSPNYTLRDQVEVDGYFYHFQLDTERGVHEVASVRGLIKRCHEIDVIEHFRETDEGGHFSKGLGSSFRGVGKGLGQAVRHPGETLKRVGAGAGRFLRATGGFFSAPFRRRQSVKASDGTDRALLGKGPAGGERRLLAYELGLDVYTENEEAMALLNEIARQRLAGKLPVGAAVFALPGGAVFTLSLTPMGYDASTEELIRDKAPTELKRELAGRYEKLTGLPAGKRATSVAALLENPNYSPREQAYLWRYLTDLGALGNLDEAMQFLGEVGTPDQAGIVCTQVELLSLLHARARRLERFVPVNQTLGARSVDGTLILVISIDTVRFQHDVTRSLRDSINAAKKHGARRIEIWSTGDIDARSVALANKMGVVVHQNILSNPLFKRPRNEGDPTLWVRGEKTAPAAAPTAPLPAAESAAQAPSPALSSPPRQSADPLRRVQVPEPTVVPAKPSEPPAEPLQPELPEILE